MKIIKRVLIVDDEPDLADSVAYEVADGGFEVATSSSGRRGLLKHRETPFDAIVSDIRMADGDGIGLMRAVKDGSPGQPIVVLMSAFTDLALESILSWGADAILAKPIELINLVATLKRLLTTPEERWQLKPGREHGDLTLTAQFASVPDAAARNLIRFGRGGFFCDAALLIAPTRRSVRFRLDFGDVVIEGLGMVVWQRRDGSGAAPGFGLEFEWLTEASIRWLCGYLAKERPIAYIPES